ncbi:hypothetical protein [Gilliamella sp. wkB308]|uniref:hypothetical protein n=1 Tax=Gilliamella sp. wkB308 TaxID=3120263 RepID=UPI00117A2820|nr:hypothetical protein [Gilliamella apicola]
MIQILLAKMQGVDVEVQRSDGGWSTSTHDVISIDLIYRIKLHELPISSEMWAMIDKKWKWAAKDYGGHVFFYTDRPFIFEEDLDWTYESGNACECALAINTDGIDWQKSLTKRPEGV